MFPSMVETLLFAVRVFFSQKFLLTEYSFNLLRNMSQVNPDDLKLPMAPIVKLMKNAGGDVNFSNEAKTSIARAAAVFCLHAAESANEFAVKEKRKTITAADIVNAMDNMDISEFKDEIKSTIEEYRAAKSTKKAKRI